MRLSIKNNKVKKYRKTKKQFGGNSPLVERMSKIKKYNSVDHPLSKFIKKKLGDKYLLVINSSNNNLINFENIYINCFIDKMLEILRFSFEREKEYHISLGNYSEGYEYSTSNIIYNLQNSKYITVILTDLELVPISFLYIEMLSDDYDKMWTVCSDKAKRGEGNSSIVVDNAIKEHKKSKRNGLLLEVYNDNVIGRKDNDPLQEDIVKHFINRGFKVKNRNELNEYTRSNLLSPKDETKVMVMDF
jgi:hypothetical protein